MNIDQSSILVTGGGGMLATAFRRVLPQAKYVDKSALDITNESAIKNLFQHDRPSLLINCAAYTKVDLAEKNEELANSVNGHAVGLLARACSEFQTMMVHYSTDYVFGGKIRRPLKYNDRVSPQSAYGRSKLLGEQLLQQNNPPSWLLIRTAWLYGPGGPCFPQAILNAARAGKPLTVVDDQIGSPTFTNDLADATLRLLDPNRRAAGIWHFTNSGETTWYNFCPAILEEFNVKANLSPISSADWKQTRPDSAIRPSYSVLDTTHFEAFTGLCPRPWREALRDYARIMNNPSS